MVRGAAITIRPPGGSSTNRRTRRSVVEPLEGRRNFTGTLTEADEESVSLEADGSPVQIPLARIRRSNLVPDLELRGSQ